MFLYHLILSAEVLSDILKDISVSRYSIYNYCVYCIVQLLLNNIIPIQPYSHHAEGPRLQSNHRLDKHVILMLRVV